MSSGPGIERQISAWLIEEAPSRAPDRILEATSLRVRRTRRRHSWRARWRFPPMSSTVRIASAAAVVVVGVAIGATLLGWPRGQVGGPATPTSSPTATVQPASGPTAGLSGPPASTAQNVTPTITFAPWQPPATELIPFTSPTHGYTISYPSNWKVRPATAELQANDFPYDLSPKVDNFGALLPQLSNPELIVASAIPSHPLTLSEWEATVLGWAATTCDPPALEDAVIGGERARLITRDHCPDHHVWAVVVHGDRVFHVIVADALATDDASLRPADRALFDTIIATFAFSK